MKISEIMGEFWIDFGRVKMIFKFLIVFGVWYKLLINLLKSLLKYTVYFLASLNFVSYF